MSIELILNAVNINLVAFSVPAAERHRTGLRDLRDCGRRRRSRGRPGHHPGVLPQQGDGQHRRDERDAVVRTEDQGPTMDLIWLIVLLPGLGAALNGLIGIRSFSKQTAGLVACTTMGAALALSGYAFWQLLGLPPEARDHVVTSWRLDSAHPARAPRTGSARSRCPGRSASIRCPAMMILVVTGIGFLIHVYSTAYMHDEPRGGYARYFAYLNLFCFFMLMLVLGEQLPGDVRGLGRRGALLVPADRLLVREEERVGRRQEGVHREPDRRLGLHPRHLPRLLHVRHAATSAPSPTPRARCRSRPPGSACSRSSACCCSSAPPARARRSRCTSGCRTPWKARRRCRR